MDRTAFTIGKAASASGVPVKTIRYYEEIGLIPKARRSNGAARTGGNRTYDGDSVGRLKFIRSARLLGLSLDDIRVLVRIAQDKGCPSKDPAYRATLLQHLQATEERMKHLSSLRATLRDLLARSSDAMHGTCVTTGCGCMSPTTSASVADVSRRGNTKGET